MTAIHIPLERLTGSVPAPAAHQDAMDGRTFYIETFGCQMNDHDSEKVAGVLLGRGYRQVDTPAEARRGSLQYLQYPRKSRAKKSSRAWGLL